VSVFTHALLTQVNVTGKILTPRGLCPTTPARSRRCSMPGLRVIWLRAIAWFWSCISAQQQPNRVPLPVAPGAITGDVDEREVLPEPRL